MADRSDRIELETRRRFSSAQMGSNESCSLYAARLEKKFRLAYPRRNVESSKKLLEKFLDTVPNELRGQMMAAKTMMRSVGLEDLTWTKAQFYASQYDLNSRSASSRNHADNYGFDGRESAEPQIFSSQWQGSGSSQDQGVGRSREVCSYCQRSGHLRNECRRRLNQCFKCGAVGHRVGACPMRRENLDYDRRNTSEN